MNNMFSAKESQESQQQIKFFLEDSDIQREGEIL